MADSPAAACDRARLSAYRDGELDVGERQQLAAHLPDCSVCRQVLQGYAQLAEELCRPGLLPRPAMMRSHLESRLSETRRPPWLGRVLPGVAAIASVAVAASVALAGLGSFPVGQRLTPLVPIFSAPAPFPAPLPNTVAAVSAEDSASAPKPEAQAVSCAEPLPSVTSVFSERPKFRASLGCATDAPRVLGLIAQPFERGSVLRRSDTREVYAIARDGRWRHLGDPAPVAQHIGFGTVSVGPAEPGEWLREISEERPEIRALLGQAAGGDQQVLGLVQPYERGVVLWDEHGRVYLLVENGESLNFENQRATRGLKERPEPQPTLEA